MKGKIQTIACEAARLIESNGLTVFQAYEVIQRLTDMYNKAVENQCKESKISFSLKDSNDG